MLKKAIKTLSLSLLFAASASQATIVDYYDTIANGHSQFASTVNGAGGTVGSVTLNGLNSGNFWDFGDFSISTTDGSSERIYQETNNASTGDMIRINPVDNNDNGAASGITFTFDSAINALGFEVGDWATCCFLPSELFISFDGGTAIKVASATQASDNPATAAGGRNGDAFFVGAIDDSSTFTTVTFFGNGFGEILTAGGTVKYSAIEIDSISVPEPSSIAILALSLIGLSLSRRKS
ncbi:PEP-CTERM sorting domain-containing protein [Colwelliaceae bacterium 6441]